MARLLPAKRLLSTKHCHFDRERYRALIMPRCVPGEKFAAIGRSYRQAAFTFPTQ
ncbi:hypothetical protein [Paenibacillus polymyxa]|uniref:hypothetical protein n=1 Tax=Paenibacillus polymyxa TaxID=1406 RepID=UPI0015E16D21|nr:hypothetical protein [Paenibacillus polymyxa]